jgi:hypothetical protein
MCNFLLGTLKLLKTFELLFCKVTNGTFLHLYNVFSGFDLLKFLQFFEQVWPKILSKMIFKILFLFWV